MTSTLTLTAARDALDALVPPDDPDRAGLLDRLERWLPDLVAGLGAAYELDEIMPGVLAMIAQHHGSRRPALRRRDAARLLRQDWFAGSDQLGYACYTERFAGDLRGVAAHVDHLAELGVTYLHLMPLLKPRPAPHDGGYAVADFRAVRADLGTMGDLAELADTLHDNGISLTLDLVLNHVAREHTWAAAARAGDLTYREYFRMFDDRTMPDAYEKTLTEVFPDTDPGSFTFDEVANAWVWTTFHAWQWDLNWANPAVFVELADVMLFLAGVGADCLRLDAIAFLWKRLGTDCRNQPEVHAITAALRAIGRIVAPSLVLKAEAIVGASELMPYLGTGRWAGKVSDLAYHNSFMVQIWSALASRDVRLMVHAMAQFPPKPVTTAWGSYIRCHDDIGWAIDDADAAAVGLNGYLHRQFLADFYNGSFPGSFSVGADFQYDERTGDRRTSGTAASMCGLQRALAAGDPAAVDAAIERILLVHAMVLGHGGMPLLYMGDEIALTNDPQWDASPDHADDNRWMHRPVMPWELVAQRHDPATVAGRVYLGLTIIIAARRHNDSFHAAVETEYRATSDSSVLLGVRRHPAGVVAMVYNLSDSPRSLHIDQIRSLGITAPWDNISKSRPHQSWDQLLLPARSAAWMVEEPGRVV